MCRGNSGHHVVGPPERRAAVELERVGEGLLQLGELGVRGVA